MLRPVNTHDAKFLYQLLAEREHPISHKELPKYGDHVKFVAKHPYRYWFVIVDKFGGNAGSIYLGFDNSVGVVIAKDHQRQGLATKAVKELIKKHKPLKPVASVRSGGYIANIAPGNDASVKLFESLGFGKIQETFRHE